MIHRVVLSNGRVLLVQEDDNSLHLGTETEGFENDFDAYIAEIKPSGLLVMPNSGMAGEYLVEGLKK